MKPRVLFYVQHLLGIGHLMRACRIAKALRETFEVLLVVGGELPPGIAPEGVGLFGCPPCGPARRGSAPWYIRMAGSSTTVTRLRVATCCSLVSTTSARHLAHRGFSVRAPPDAVRAASLARACRSQRRIGP